MMPQNLNPKTVKLPALSLELKNAKINTLYGERVKSRILEVTIDEIQKEMIRLPDLNLDEAMFDLSFGLKF